MKSLYNIFAFITLLIIVGIFMYFIVYTENFDIDVRSEKIVNKDLLSHSIMIQDNVVEEYETVLNQNSLCNSIKYSEGMKWDDWVIVKDDDVLQMIGENVKKYIEQDCGIDTKMLFCKLNRYRRCLSDEEMIFLDYDIVLYNKIKKHADHGKLLCVFKNKKGIDIVHYRVVGKINEDYIFMKNDQIDNSIPGNASNGSHGSHGSNGSNGSNGSDTNDIDIFDKNYSSYKQQNKYMGDFIDSDDTRDSMRSHDNQVKQLLYNKMMGYSNTYIDDEDYIKNKEHKRAHKIVRNMFMNGLKDSKKNSLNETSIYMYKSYPYKTDLIITF